MAAPVGRKYPQTIATPTTMDVTVSAVTDGTASGSGPRSGPADNLAIAYPLFNCVKTIDDKLVFSRKIQ